MQGGRGCHLGARRCGGPGVSIVLPREVPHPETRANQELGRPPWPGARLTQGDLFAKALRPDTSDEMCPCRCPARTPLPTWPACRGVRGGSPARGPGLDPGARGAPCMSFARNSTWL